MTNPFHMKLSDFQNPEGLKFIESVPVEFIAMKVDIINNTILIRSLVMDGDNKGQNAVIKMRLNNKNGDVNKDFRDMALKFFSLDDLCAGKVHPAMLTNYKFKATPKLESFQGRTGEMVTMTKWTDFENLGQVKEDGF